MKMSEGTTSTLAQKICPRLILKGWEEGVAGEGALFIYIFINCKIKPRVLLLFLVLEKS